MQTKVKGYRGLGINYNCDHELGFYSNSQVTRNGVVCTVMNIDGYR